MSHINEIHRDAMPQSISQWTGRGQGVVTLDAPAANQPPATPRLGGFPDIRPGGRGDVPRRVREARSTHAPDGPNSSRVPDTDGIGAGPRRPRRAGPGA